jgi:hypothetical protein
MVTTQQEPVWVVEDRKRAREEGLSVVDGNVWYRNPEGRNGAGSQFSGTEQTGYLVETADRIQDVGLCGKTHLQIKIDQKWYEAPIALGQLLSCIDIPIKGMRNGGTAWLLVFSSNSVTT